MEKLQKHWLASFTQTGNILLSTKFLFKTFQLHFQLLPTTFHAAPKVFTSNFTMDGWFDQATAGKIKDFMGVGEEASLASESTCTCFCWTQWMLISVGSVAAKNQEKKEGLPKKGEKIRKNSSLKRMFHSNSPGLWEKEGVWFLLWVYIICFTILCGNVQDGLIAIIFLSTSHQ